MRAPRPRSVALLALAALAAAAAPESARAQCAYEATVVSPDLADYDAFGRSVAVVGDMLVVGIEYDDDLGQASGGVWVFERVGAGWVPQQKLLQSTGTAGDRFGFAVDTDGRTIIVGAYLYDTTVLRGGAAFIFENDGTRWVETARLEPQVPVTDDRFGNAVAVNGDVAAVGTPGDFSGLVTTYRRGPAGWALEQALRSASRMSLDSFGEALALSGGVLAVGAWNRDSQKGIAFVFEWDGAAFVETATLAAPDGIAGDRFGSTVAASADTIAVGAYRHATPIVGAGAVYLFDRAPGWPLATELVASDATTGDGFGFALDFASDLLLVGAFNASSRAATDPGAAYLFRRAAGTWSEVARLDPQSPTGNDDAGYDVSIDGGTAVIAAPTHARAASGNDAGAVFTYGACDVVPPATADLLRNASPRTRSFTDPPLDTFLPLDPVGDLHVAGFVSGNVDSDSAGVAGLPLVFYEMVGAFELHVARDPTGVRLDF